jgi:hypothetical protein
VSLVDVELPNHVRFTQYVFRMRRCAMTVVPVDETSAMIARGEILGAITIIGVQPALLRRAAARVPSP